MRRCLTVLSLVLSLVLAGPLPATAQPRGSYTYSGFATVQKGSTLYMFGGLIGRPGAPPSTLNVSLDVETGRLVTLSGDRRFSFGPAAVLVDDRVYVSGGMSTSYTSVPGGGAAMGWSDQFAAYDLKTDRWTSLPRLKRALTDHCAFAAEGHIYLLGGTLGGAGIFRKAEPNGEVLVYSIARRLWSVRPGPGKPMTASAGCAQSGDEFILVGGADGGVIDGRVWAWNFRTGAWRRLPDLPARLMDTATGVGPDGTLVVTGGAVATATGALIDASPDIWVLPPGAGAWRKAGSVPEGRANHGLIMVGNRGWLVGGAPGVAFRRRSTSIPLPEMWVEALGELQIPAKP